MGTSEIWCFLHQSPPIPSREATCVKSTTVVQAGSQSKASSRAEDSRDEKGNRSAGQAGPLGKHRPPRLAEGKARLRNKAASSALFSTLSLPLSICLSLPFFLSPVSSPLANLHLLISIQHVYELIPTLLYLCVKIGCFLTPHPTPWQSVHFVPQAGFSDNSWTESLTLTSTQATEGPQR